MNLNNIIPYFRKNWFLLNLLIIFSYLSYQIINFLTSNTHKIQAINNVHFNVFGFILILMALLIISLSIYKNVKNILFFILISLSYIFLIVGYLIQKNPKLDWTESDVARYNFNACIEVKEFGAFYIIRTWNARANPYDTTGYDPIAKKIARDLIKKYNIEWLVRSQWKTKEIIHVDNFNNRPYMHPPLAPIMMGYWYKLFPYGHVSIMIFITILNLIGFALFFWGSKSFIIEDYSKIILITFITSPIFILYNFPSSEQLTMLLLGISVLLLIKNKENDWKITYTAGLIISLAFYSKFTIIFYILFQSIAFIIFKIKNKIIQFLSYSAGVLTIMLFFTLLNYNFLLTFITGKAVSIRYSLDHPTTVLESLIKLTYFGPPVIFFVGLLIIQIFIKDNNIQHKHIYFPLLIGIAFTIISLTDSNALGRYIVVFTIALTYFIHFTLEKLKLNKINVLLIPFINIVFLFLNIYF